MTGLPASWHQPLAHPDWRACRAGREPAEILPSRLRAQLVRQLLGAGWSVGEVAGHCRMTLYTTVRIAGADRAFFRAS